MWPFKHNYKPEIVKIPQEYELEFVDEEIADQTEGLGELYSDFGYIIYKTTVLYGANTNRVCS